VVRSARHCKALYALRTFLRATRPKGSPSNLANQLAALRRALRASLGADIYSPKSKIKTSLMYHQPETTLRGKRIWVGPPLLAALSVILGLVVRLLSAVASAVVPVVAPAKSALRF
jgi:hypothetical protein